MCHKMCCKSKFASSALEIDSISNQHCKFYNNFVKVWECEWLFVCQPRRGISGEFYNLDSDGRLSQCDVNREPVFARTMLEISDTEQVTISYNGLESTVFRISSC